MAKTHKRNKKMGKGGRVVLIAFVALLAGLALLAGIGSINAGVVRVRRAEVVLRNLPATFDGATILYASDIDLCGVNNAGKSGALFRKLQSLEPDILLLGGDYISPSLLEILNRGSDSSESTARMLKERTDFFHYIASFDAPFGKFAVAAPEDPDREGLAALAREAGVTPLFNDRASIVIGGDTMWLVGICEESAHLNSAGAAFNRDDCVIVAAYGPSVLPVLLTSEASDGGSWTDLALCGHTHGGQVRLFGRSILPLNSQEQRHTSGWSLENGLPILVTQGVGCEGLNLRLGSAPEVWLLTLRQE